MARQSGKQRRGVNRKRRTRAHVIADLSANHVERFVLRCGHTAELIRHDYGVDMLIFFYGTDGQRLDAQVIIQLKASDRPDYVKNGSAVAIRVDRRDLHLWMAQNQPLFLVAYDARADKAYWLYVQAAVAVRRELRRKRGVQSLTLHVPTKNLVNDAAIREFLRYNNRLSRQLRGIAQHYD